MASFAIAAPKTLKLEGAYQRDPADKGNYNSLGQLVGTNHGISAPTAENYYRRPPSIQDMKNISLSTAKNIYKNLYWDKILGDAMKNQSIAEVVFDHAITSGPGSAGKILQYALNFKGKDVDGIIGPKTLAALNAYAFPSALFNKIKQLRADFYRDLNNSKYERGWLNRVASFAYENPGKSSAGILTFLTISFLLYKYLQKKRR